MADIIPTPTATKPWFSRTLWINLLVAGSAFIPTVGDFVKAHPDWVIMGFSMLNMGLRLITKDKISLGE